MDPGNGLVSAAEYGCHAEADRLYKFFHGAALRAQYDAGTDDDESFTLGRDRGDRLFPKAAGLAEEVCVRRGRFFEGLRVGNTGVGPVPTDGGGTDDRLYVIGDLAECFYERCAAVG